MRNLSPVNYKTPMSQIVPIAKELGIKWVGVNKTELILNVNGAISRVKRGKAA